LFPILYRRLFPLHNYFSPSPISSISQMQSAD
jgi:hypothetical protein